MFRNIIWDLDGTLFDTYPAIAGAFRAALADLGKDAPLDWIGNLAKISIGHCETSLAERYRLSEEEIDQKFGEHYDLISPEEQPPFPGVRLLCEYICSIRGKNVIVTHRGRQGTDMLLATHRLTGCFTGSLAHEDGYPRKPDPAAFVAAMEKYDLKREETLAVGDREIDIQAARAAGIFTCLFGEGGGGINADLTVCNYDELMQYIVAENRLFHSTNARI
jgi:phosphoglycolate phosphatase-like HAD superfamily hydrolase